MDGFVRTRVVEHTEWVLPNPTCIGEILKGVRGAMKMAEARNLDTDCDDWLTITGDEESVVLRLTTEREDDRKASRHSGRHSAGGET